LQSELLVLQEEIKTLKRKLEETSTYQQEKTCRTEVVYFQDKIFNGIGLPPHHRVVNASVHMKQAQERDRLQVEANTNQTARGQIGQLNEEILTLNEEVAILNEEVAILRPAAAKLPGKQYPRRPLDLGKLVCGRIWLGFAITLCPMASPYALEQMVVFMTMSLLSDIGMLEEEDFDCKLLPRSLPGRKTYECLLHESLHRLCILRCYQKSDVRQQII
jgi:hypothetical protein